MYKNIIYTLFLSGLLWTASVCAQPAGERISNLIPHAVWYDDANVTFPPELSGRNPLYRDELPAFNAFLARMRYMLARPGRHVADVAMLYPVQTQYAGHYLDGPLAVALSSVEADVSSVSDCQPFSYIHKVLAEDGGDVQPDNSITQQQ